MDREAQTIVLNINALNASTIAALAEGGFGIVDDPNIRVFVRPAQQAPASPIASPEATQD